MPKLTSISRYHALPLSLGVLCIALAIWLSLSNDPQANSLSEPFSQNSEYSENSQTQITRSKARKKTTLSTQPRLNALEKYLADTSQGLTRSQVISIVNEIKDAFPEGDYPEPNTIEMVRKVRDQQIKIFIYAVSDALSLSLHQRNDLKQELHARADQEFSEFSASMLKPITSDGKQYQFVNGGKLSKLFTPVSWLDEINLHEIITLNESQESILWPINIDPFLEDNQHSQELTTISNVTEKPKTDNHAPLLAEGPFYRGRTPYRELLTPNPIPLTLEQKTAIFTLEKNRSTEITQPDYFLDQSFLLSRAQLTLSLLLRPKNATTLQKALSGN